VHDVLSGQITGYAARPPGIARPAGAQPGAVEGHHARQRVRVGQQRRDAVELRSGVHVGPVVPGVAVGLQVVLHDGSS
jgi:hypothetical protein